MDKVFIRNLYLYIFGLAIFGIFFLGYSIENSYYIPIVLNNADPNLYPTDLLVNSQSVYHSLFFSITGYLVRYIDLKLLFTALSFMTTIAIAFSIFYLSLLLFKDKLTAYLAVFLLLISKGGISLTGIGIHQSLFEPSIMVIPFSLFSIYLFLKERYRIACLITGLMFYIHGVEAFSVSIMFLFYFLVKIRNLHKRQILQSIFLLFLPVLLIVWRLLSKVFFEVYSQEVIRQWLAILHFRSFWHLFPFSWGPGDYFKYSGWFLWAFIVYRYSAPSEKHDSIIIFCKAIALLCLIGTIFVEIIPVPIVIKMMLWRSTLFFVLFLLIYISRYLINFPKENLVSKLLVAGTLAAIFFSFSKLIVCFALLHLAFEMRNKKYLFYLFATGGVVGILGFSLGSFLNLEAGTFLLNKLLSFVNLGMKNIIFFYLLFGFLVYFLHLQQTERIKFSRRQIFLLVFFFTFLVLINSFLPKDINKQSFEKDWINTQIWARENTSSETVFITPPYLEGFRIHSQRGIAVENKDGGVSIFDIKFALEWWQRMNVLGYNNLSITVLDFVPECKKAYNNLDEKEIIQLSNKYEADYIVTEKEKQLDLELAYQNDHFKVYSVRKDRVF
ncbi:MAG: hypothetical protein ISS47_01090 [Candidatus Omnitrophica bacterium]|nr:hypothetical protein [Candidatus Omnitrophota bacterium]